jgi:hypothetical protein
MENLIKTPEQLLLFDLTTEEKIIAAEYEFLKAPQPQQMRRKVMNLYFIKNYEKLR